MRRGFIALLVGVALAAGAAFAYPQGARAVPQIGDANTTSSLGNDLYGGNYSIFGVNNLTGSMSAGYVSAGTFGSLSSTGNYYFDTDTLSIDAGNHRIGIGTTGPLELLDVRGDISLGAGNGELLLYRDTPGDYAKIGAVVEGSGDVGIRFYTTTAGGGNEEERMRIGHQGYVGIGTTVPVSRLHVVNNSGTIPTHNSQFLFQNNNITSRTAIITLLAGNQGVSRIQFADAEQGYAGGIDYNHSTNDMTFRVNNADKVTIDSSGSVGIGTTTPAYRLDVQGGQVNTSGGLCMSGDCKTAWSQVGGGGSAEGWSRTGTAVHLTTSSDSVGIGTTTPATALQVAGTVTADAFSGPLTGSLSAGYVSAGTFGSLSTKGNYTFQASGDTDPVLFVDAANKRVGIGTAGPDEKLTVRGNLRVFDPNSADTFVKLYGLGADDGYVSVYANNVETIRLAGNGNSYLSGGNVGIGTATPTTELQVKGSSGGTEIRSIGASGGNAALGLRADQGSNDGDSWQILAKASGNNFEVQSYSTGAWVTALAIDTSGLVGIGTTTPAYPLTVSGVIHSATGGFRFPDDTVQTTAYGGETQTINASYVSAGTFGSLSTKGNYTFQASGDTDPVLFVDAANKRVGVGTTGPAVELDVDGAIRAKIGVGYGFQLGAPDGTYGSMIFKDGSQNMVLGIPSGDVIRIVSSAGSGLVDFEEDGDVLITAGNVGIGTTGPDSVLDIYQSSDPILILSSDANTDKTLSFRDADSEVAFVKYDYEPSLGVLRVGTIANRDTAIHAGGSEIIRVENTGEVGIGTTGPTAKLHIDEDAQVGLLVQGGNAGTNVARFQRDVGGDGTVDISVSGADPQIEFDVEGGGQAWSMGVDDGDGDKFKIAHNATIGDTGDFVIDSSGQVGIGTTGPGDILEISSSGSDEGMTISNPKPQITLTDSDGPKGFDLGLQAYDFTLTSTDAGEVLRVDQSTGNVGIGTTTPAYPLTVAGTIHSSTGGFRFPDDTVQTTAYGGETQTINASYVSAGTFGSLSTKGNYTFQASGDTDPVLFIDAANKRVGVGTTGPSYKLDISGSNSLGIDDYVFHNGDTNTYFGFAGADIFKIRTAGTDRIYVNSGGDVGIGTTNPNYKLEVDGTTDIGGTLTLGNGSGGMLSWGTTPVNPSAVVMAGSGRALWLGADNSTSEGILIADGGNVGIGTTSPGVKLQINQSADSLGLNIYGHDDRSGNYIKMNINSNGYGIVDSTSARIEKQGNINIGYWEDPKLLMYDEKLVTFGSGNDFSIGYSDGEDYLQFVDGVTLGTNVRMVIDNAGYVGIGTTGPSYKLDVQGGQVNASGGLCMSGDCKTAWSQVGGGGSAEGWSRTGTAVHLTTSTDHVGIGTTTPATALHVAGTVTADAFSGPMTGSLNAGYVSAGTFGSLSSAGNYYFDTDTLSIDAGNHRVGIGTASPGEKLHLAQGNFGLSQTSADAYVFLGDTANFGAGTYGYAKWDYANDKLQLGTSAGGVGLTLEEDGKVGIGTTSPPFRLSVDADDGLNSLLYLRNSDGAGDGDAAARFTVSGGNDWVIGVDDSDSDKFKISDNSQLGTNDYVTIQTDGNVGIGTTSPARSLHVHTPSGGWVARFSSGSYYTDTYNNADWAEFVTNSSRWYLDKELRVDTGLIGSYNENLVLRTSGTNRITVLNSNGNVGIGTTGPNYKLDVQGGQVNASGGLCMSGDCKTAWSEVGGGGGTNYWSISGNNLAPTSTAYKVGIGTASPSAKLDILGTANEPQLEITAYSTQSNTNPLILLKNSGGSEILRIHSNEDDWNTFVGGYAGAANTTGYQNTGVGRETLESNTTGYYNVAVGSVALDANTTGHDNVAVGRNALGSNVAAHYNTAVGSEALRALSGEYYYNTAVGARALYNNTSSGNSALGKDTLYTNTTGYYNVGVGYEALSSNSSGYQNTAVGRGTLDNNTTGDNNTAIGMDANVSTGNLTNATAIGYGASVNASNKVRIGNSSISVIEGKVAWSYPSDIRLKREVQDSDLGLSFINKLRPVSYKLKNGDDNINYGFVAQEVEMVLGGKKTNIVMTSGDRDGTKTMRYTEFIAPMVRAMQEQQVQIEALKAENDALQARISALERKVR